MHGIYIIYYHLLSRIVMTNLILKQMQENKFSHIMNLMYETMKLFIRLTIEYSDGIPSPLQYSFTNERFLIPKKVLDHNLQYKLKISHRYNHTKFTWQKINKIICICTCYFVIYLYFTVRMQ